MTAACITFDQIEYRAEKSLALAIWAKRASANALAAIVCNILLGALHSSLHSFERLLTTQLLDQLSQDQLKELAGRLQELVPRLTALCSATKNPHVSRLLFDPLVRNICESTDSLESILENILFALRPEFHDAISSAIERLGIEAEASAVMSR